MEARLWGEHHGIFDGHGPDSSLPIKVKNDEWNPGFAGMGRLMAERYREVWVAETQPADEAGNPTGPLYKGGLTAEVISAYPELDWMIEADQHVPSVETDEQLVWVLAEDWDRWREKHLEIEPEPDLSQPATPPM